MPKTGLTSEALKEKALEIAMDNIRTHGLHRFRLTDIARNLKVTHAALYNHFPDKATLLDTISDRWLLEIDAALEEITHQDLPPVDLITIWFLEFHRLKLKKVLLDPELYRSFNMAVESKKPFVSRHLREIHNQLLNLVNKAVAAGALPITSPESTVDLLFEATMAFHHPCLVLEHKDEQREEMLQRIVRTILKGLR